MAAATAPGLSYVHQWTSGDVVMWDNRATMHRGRPWPAHEARFHGAHDDFGNRGGRFGVDATAGPAGGVHRVHTGSRRAHA